jgi:hypothetical protein
MLIAGLIVGLTIGGAMAVGVLLGQRGSSLADTPSLAELKLKAAASHGGENFAIATGPVDEDVEGLFTLDFLTGALQCFVINPKTHTLGGRFFANVNAPNVFGAKKGKKPAFLLVTGQYNASGGGQRAGGSVCYVVDANSGEVAAFGVPWNKSQAIAGAPQEQPLIPMQKWAARDQQK